VYVLRSKSRVAVCLVAMASLALTACSNDDDSPSGGSGGDGEPTKLVLLVEKAGESSFAVDDFYNGFTMAVDEINADGGINGVEIETERFPSSVTDPQQAVQALQRAAGADPTVVIGMPALSTVRATLPQVAQLGVPFLHLSYGNLTTEDVESGGGQIFQPLGPDEHGLLPENAATYAVNDLGAKKIGLLYVDLSLGENAKETLTSTVEELGGEVVVERSYAVDATDLTEQVLAMKDAGVDAVIHWGYPNQLAVQLQQFEQNGMTDIPTVGGTASNIVAQNALASVEALKNLYGSVVCNPLGDQPEWSSAYEEEFGVPATANAAFTYDIVHLVKAAVESGGSTEPDAITEALQGIDYTEGVCLSEYTDQGEAHVLSDGGVIAHFGTDIPETVLTN